MTKLEKLKLKLTLAQIKQKTIAENLSVEPPFVSAVLAGRERSERVLNEAERLLNEVLDRSPALRAYFESEGV